METKRLLGVGSCIATFFAVVLETRDEFRGHNTDSGGCVYELGIMSPDSPPYPESQMEMSFVRWQKVSLCSS
ncbi:hypothetical protein KAX17_02660, partial [Candidatus Bipolaricaulota bacterium]|nr:hypothetical protein [Candidatus Bipolaricaulota bacterium]